MVDWALSLAPQRTGPGEDPKRVLKDALRGLIPDTLLNRPKSGFTLPYGAWMRGEFKEMVMDHLRPDRIRSKGFFRPKAVAKLIEDHMKAIRPATTYQLWSLLVFDLWHDLYFRKTSPAALRHEKARLMAA